MRSSHLLAKASRAERRIVRRRSLVVTSFATLLAAMWVLPLVNGSLTSLKTRQQISDTQSLVLPVDAIKVEVDGEEYDVYEVPFDEGLRELVIVRKGRQESIFIDPNDPERTEIVWEGKWRTLTRVSELNLHWENYPEAYSKMKYLQLLRNTLMYTTTTLIGQLLSSIMIAYGFARFNFRFKNTLFVLMLATMILPPTVTLVPQYVLYTQLGWVGSYLPLIVPHYFGAAFNVFLLRQYFMTIPREMEEAARIDGAGPILTLRYVVLPQAKPAIVAMSLFHIFYIWGDFFDPLIYLTGKPDLLPFSVGLATFQTLYDTEPHLIQAGAVMTLALPVLVFLLAQRVFIQGVVTTGSK